MRFFSNDNRDADPNEEQDSTVQLRTDNPVDPSEPAVPLQRSGSPWSAAPGDTDHPTLPAADTLPAAGRPADDYADADAELAAQERADGSDEPGYAGDHRTGTDAVDLPLDDDHHPDVRSAPAADDTSVATAPVDRENRVDSGVPVEATSTTTTYGPDGTVTDTGASDRGGVDDVSSTEVSPAGAAALRDDGGFDDPTAVDPATDRPLEDTDRADSVSDGVEDTTATAGPASAETRSEARDVLLDETPADTTPVAAGDTTATAASTGDKLPGTVAEPDLTTIFHPDDAASFHDRWRDVQLKFVDNPKEATTEAAGLLDEAVEKLAASLRDQKSTLHQVDSDDTETLRVELRGYRDILNRVLGL